MTPPNNPISLKPTNTKPAGTRGPEWWLMVRKFVSHGTSIASFSPSSRFLCRSIVKGINWDKAKCVVELGAGTGPITRELVKAAGPNTRLVIVELDPDFCKVLRHKFPNHEIIEGDACKLDQILAERGISHADHVISGLPLPSFPAALRDSIIAMSAKVLTPEGDFRQLTNMPWIYRKLYKRYFSNVSFKLVPLNLPPGGVYYCTGYSKANEIQPVM
ncbi:MAG: rRNA adenine N-6-methyltransferase family protein [Zavarzinella sp.]